MLRSVCRHLFVDNPAMIYVNARAWRSFRCWGWLWALVPVLALLTLGTSTETLAVKSKVVEAILNRFDVRTVAWPLVIFAVMWITAGVCSVLKQLLHPDNVEPLFLSRLAPEQIWTACMLNINRRLVTLFLLIAPVLFLRATIEDLTGLQLLHLCVAIFAIANLWGLFFCALAMQWGVRRLTLINLALFVFLFVVTTSSTLRGSQQLPAYALLNPLSHVTSAYFNLIHPTYPGNAEWVRRITIVGFPVSETMGLLILFSIVATALLLWLTAGPFRLPARREEEVMRRVKYAGRSRIGRIFGFLGKISEIELAHFGSASVYSWRYTIDRLYENSLSRFRRSLFWKSFVSTLLYTLAIALVMDSFAGGKVISAANPAHSLFFFMVLTIFGLIASFHLCYAGRQDERTRLLFSATEIPASGRARLVIFLCKIAAALGVIWLAGTANPSIGWGWPFLPKNLLMGALTALIVTSQSLLLIYVSRRAIFPRQALSAGLFHVLSVSLVPGLLMNVLGGYAPHLLTKKIGIGSFCSITPITAFPDIANNIAWTAKSNLDGSIHRWNEHWQWSMGFFLLETILFALLLARDFRKSAVAQAVKQEVAS